MKFFEPRMTVAPAVGAADAVIADMSAAVSAASIPTIITERHFFLLIASFLPIVVHGFKLHQAVATPSTDGGSSGRSAVST